MLNFWKDAPIIFPNDIFLRVGGGKKQLIQIKKRNKQKIKLV
jgi:hypothetical protein